MGHFVSCPREREKKDRRDSRGDEREGQGRKRIMKECDETEETRKFHREFMSPTLFLFELFVCVEVLRPSQPNGVMSRGTCLRNYFKIMPWGWPSCSAEGNHLSNFGKGPQVKHFCDV